MEAPILVKCVAKAIYQQLQCHRRLPISEKSHLFHEGAFLSRPWNLVFPALLPSTCPVTIFHAEHAPVHFDFPRLEEITAFLERFLDGALLSSECAVILLIYVQRLVAKNITMTHFNWKPVLLAALLVSSKMWEDTCHWNVEFAEVAWEYPLKAINQLEARFCLVLDFRFHINGADYARYYYELRMNESSQVLSYQAQSRLRWKREGQGTEAEMLLDEEERYLP